MAPRPQSFQESTCRYMIVGHEHRHRQPHLLSELVFRRETNGCGLAPVEGSTTLVAERQKLLERIKQLVRDVATCRAREANCDDD